jgi:predicted amidohydrolase/NH3-dependent NAD+ synthetase
MARAILAAAAEAERAGARLVVTPELSLCGYPPEDLVLRPAFLDACASELAALAGSVRRTPVIVGFPERSGGRCHNALAVLREGRVAEVYRKQQLPNYTVFDEERYFEPGNAPCVIDVDGMRCGLLICEDVWYPGPSRQAQAAGARVIVVINGSPYHTRQQSARVDQVGTRARETGLPYVYVNRVGGQDELVFDGASFVMSAHGEIVQQMPAWHEGLSLATFADGVPKPVRGSLDARLEHHVYEALVMGVRDYVGKNRFPGVLLGLSGGVDSALVLAVAVDALGAERVRAVMMPSPYTRGISLDDAREMAAIVGVRYSEIPIEGTFESYLAALAGEFEGTGARCGRGEHPGAHPRHAADGAFEQIRLDRAHDRQQVRDGRRLRDALRRHGRRLRRAEGHQQDARLSAVPLSQLARPRDSRADHRRAPSAELRADQVDQDSLPPYDALDGILEAYVEHDKSPAQIVAMGFAPEHVRQVVRLIKVNEYKRRQAGRRNPDHAARLRPRLALPDHLGVERMGGARHARRLLGCRSMV